ncbi:MAG: hypothetical protein AABY40_01900, partial [Nanoarchaeota archaeon]
ATKYVCPDGSTVSDSALCPQAEEKEAAVVETSTTSEVEELLAKSKNVVSMSYDYKRVDQPLEKPLKVWIKKVTVKQELPTQTNILNSKEMDIIVFNTLAKTANAYCESKKYCIKTGDIGAVDYNQYYLKTPLDWIEGVSSAKKKGEARLANRDVWILQLEGEVIMYVDTFFGVPLRVDNGQERYEFQNPVFNGVTDEEVQYMEKEDRY